MTTTTPGFVVLVRAIADSGALSEVGGEAEPPSTASGGLTAWLAASVAVGALSTVQRRSPHNRPLSIAASEDATGPGRPGVVVGSFYFGRKALAFPLSRK